MHRVLQETKKITQNNFIYGELGRTDFTVLQETKKITQNNFIYGELGRTDYQTKRYFIIIKYCVKLLVLQRENIYHIFTILC